MANLKIIEGELNVIQKATLYLDLHEEIKRLQKLLDRSIAVIAHYACREHGAHAKNFLDSLNNEEKEDT